ETDIGRARNRRSEIIIEYKPQTQKAKTTPARPTYIRQPRNQQRQVIEIEQIKQTANTQPQQEIPKEINQSNNFIDEIEIDIDIDNID
ncbi:MAG: hypothetical protein LBT79_03350, partial [Elusimicrobiota bacterium]|nr:hypothetical protein [Elusimicrobiota bacterium]